MDPEGMVHALEMTCNMLTRDGVLVNIQPIGRPRPLEVHGDGQVRQVGVIHHRRGFADQRLSLEAIAQVRREGLFRLEEEQVFPFLYHAPSIDEFEDWLAEHSSTAILDQMTVDQARQLTRTIGKDAQVVMRETVYIGRLRPSLVKCKIT